MKNIFSYLKPYRKQIFWAIVLVAISTICNLLLPTLMSEIIDRGVYGKDMPYILKCCGIMLLVALAGLGSILGGTRLSTIVVARFSQDLRSSIFRKVNTLSFEEFSTLGTAALVTRSTHDVGTVSWVASMLAGTIITIPVLFIGGVVLSFMKDVTLSLIVFAVIPILFLIVVAIGNKITPLWEISDQYTDRQNDIMRERLRGIRVIRAFRSEDKEHARISEATHVMADNIIKCNTSMGMISPIATFMLNVVVLLIVYVGAGQLTPGGSPSAGDIFAIIQYVTLTMSGVMTAAFSIIMYPHARIAARRINQVLKAKGMADQIPEQDLSFQGEIVFDHVSFCYEGATEKAIDNVNLTIHPGQKISIIGGTGSGKSTLTALMMGFHAPTEGKILFDGHATTDLSKKTLRRNISCVLQKCAIYSGTIRENIMMGNPTASERQLDEAAQIAQLSNYISTLPEGYDYEIKQSGKNLSGGQKQRLAIARAIIKDAPIYLFDDSFSALDFLTEANLRNALNQKIKGKTQIVITQRITSAMSSDCIFVMDKGKLLDAGKHEELLRRCKVYQEIYASQTGGAAQ